MATKNDQTPKLENERWKLAQNITRNSTFGLAALAIAAIFFSEDKAQTAQMAFTAVVPLLASWVDAVLAYYYSSENLEAATKSVKDLVSVEDKLRAIPVSQVMIKITEIAYFPQDDTQKVQDLLKTLKASGKGERLPFLNNDKHPIYMLHKSAIDGALVEGVTAGLNIADM